jgi:hypothetical protein
MTINALTIIDSEGVGATAGQKMISELLKIGVIYECREHSFCYHATIKWDALDALIDELGLEECGFCWRGAPTHQVPIDSGKLPAGSLMGDARRPLMLCDECALLIQTGDRELLAERSLRASVELNARVNRKRFDEDGREKVADYLRPTVETMVTETLGAAIGKPFPLPPRPTGFIVIGET